jgi:hypothetical protein
MIPITQAMVCANDHVFDARRHERYCPCGDRQRVPLARWLNRPRPEPTVASQMEESWRRAHALSFSAEGLRDDQGSCLRCGRVMGREEWLTSTCARQPDETGSGSLQEIVH